MNNYKVTAQFRSYTIVTTVRCEHHDTAREIARTRINPKLFKKVEFLGFMTQPVES